MSYIPYGFMQTPTGISVQPQQANTVQQIYQRYLAGDSLDGIADFLFESSISSPQGKEHWTRPVIMNLLSNPKYIGYIIGFDTLFRVQGERGKRSNIDEETGKRRVARYSSQNVLSGLLICGECGANYRRITRPSGEVVWRCANRLEHGKKICKHAPSISESSLKEALCRLLSMVDLDKETLLQAADFITIQKIGELKITYKQQEFTQTMCN